tara:strand:- start:50333 stop:50548 length:216 start_codon:yes stop_codon:yes gene_type:complete
LSFIEGGVKNITHFFRREGWIKTFDIFGDICTLCNLLVGLLMDLGEKHNLIKGLFFTSIKFLIKYLNEGGR